MSSSAIGRRIERGEWTPLLPRVYRVDAAATSWKGRLWAALLWSGRGSAISHEAAAAVWELEGFEEGPVVVSTTRSLTATGGVRVHRVRAFGPADVETVDGLAVTSAARTLLDLATVATEAGVEAALDHALRVRLLSVAKLRWFVQRHSGRGRSGTAALRRLLDARPTGYVPPESPLERKVYDVIVRAGLPQPLRQHDVHDGEVFVARLDLAYPGALVAVEVDGYRWYSGRGAWARDLTRRNRLTAMGWHVLHVTYEDVVKHPEQMVRQLRRLLSGRTASRIAR